MNTTENITEYSSGNNIETTVSNSESENGFINDFENEMRDITGENPEINSKESPDNLEISDEVVEGISLEQLLAVCPPDLLSDIVSPSLWIAKKTMLKDIPEKEREEIGRLFKTPTELVELKKSLWQKVINQYFPNVNGKVSPLYALILIESLQTMKVVTEVKNLLAERQFVNGGKNETEN